MAGQRHEIVVDSSVVVKWFSVEEDTEKALSLKDQHVKGTRTLSVCDLLYFEVANALRFKRTFDETSLGEAMNRLFALHLQRGAVDPNLLGHAANIAYKSGVTIYDAVPVALAKMRGIQCITSDVETQYKKLRAHGYPIELLSET